MANVLFYSHIPCFVNPSLLNLGFVKGMSLISDHAKELNPVFASYSNVIIRGPDLQCLWNTCIYKIFARITQAHLPYSLISASTQQNLLKYQSTVHPREYILPSALSIGIHLQTPYSPVGMPTQVLLFKLNAIL